LDKSPVDVICGDRHLRQVVEKVGQQNLRRQHRQKRQEQRSDGHAEHISEVGTRPYQQILHHIAEGFAPFDDALVQHVQAALKQNCVGGILGDIRPDVRRDEFVRADLAEPQARLCSAKTGPGVYLGISWPSHLELVASS
jgi:hypothetical protein